MGAAILGEFVTKATTGVHFAPKARYVGITFPIRADIPGELMRYIRGSIEAFRDAGLWYRIMDGGDARLSLKYLDLEPPSAYQQLSLLDLKGGYILFGSFGAIAIATLTSEFVIQGLKLWYTKLLGVFSTDQHASRVTPVGGEVTKLEFRIVSMKPGDACH